MRWRFSAGLLLVLALLIPASPAVAQTGSSTRDETTCQAVMYTDIRELFVIDVETASDLEIRMLANQVSSVARAESLVELFGAVQNVLRDGTPEEIREFLRSTWEIAWNIDIRVAVNRIEGHPNSGAHVQAAAREALDGDPDAQRTFLNHGLYVAISLDAGWPVKMYTDIRELFVIDVETASDLEIRMLANQVSSVARAESLVQLFGAVQNVLRDGTPEEIREFLRSTWEIAWNIDIRVAVNRIEGDPNSGAHVQAGAREALDGYPDAQRTFLNHGLYVARALDICEAQPA